MVTGLHRLFSVVLWLRPYLLSVFTSVIRYKTIIYNGRLFINKHNCFSGMTDYIAIGGVETSKRLLVVVNIVHLPLFYIDLSTRSVFLWVEYGLVASEQALSLSLAFPFSFPSTGPPPIPQRVCSQDTVIIKFR